MARYVLLRIDDDEEADDLLRDLVTAPTSPLLTPRFERPVHVEVVPGIDAGDRTTTNSWGLIRLSKDERPGLVSFVRDSYRRATQLAEEEL
jgi:hypothetical protein